MGQPTERWDYPVLPVKHPKDEINDALHQMQGTPDNSRELF
nr:hypothetical protein [Prevotella sp.]